MSDAWRQPARLTDLYRTMARIRAFEETALEAHKAGEIPGPLHVSIGQEAVAAGICINLRRDDRITSNHRGHGHAIAKGADPTRMMAELYGRATGYCGGKGGSMHIADFSVGMLGANGVVAGGIPIAVGAAQGLKMQKSDAIVDLHVRRRRGQSRAVPRRVSTGPRSTGCRCCSCARTTASRPSPAPTASPPARARIDAGARRSACRRSSVDGNDVIAVDEAAQARGRGGAARARARTCCTRAPIGSRATPRPTRPRGGRPSEVEAARCARADRAARRACWPSAASRPTSLRRSVDAGRRRDRGGARGRARGAVAGAGASPSRTCRISGAVAWRR